jgi:hypothetical protein
MPPIMASSSVQDTAAAARAAAAAGAGQGFAGTIASSPQGSNAPSTAMKNLLGQ